MLAVGWDNERAYGGQYGGQATAASERQVAKTTNYVGRKILVRTDFNSATCHDDCLQYTNHQRKQRAETPIKGGRTRDGKSVDSLIARVADERYHEENQGGR